ncbi:MAG: pyridoxal phosphate-dependent aminotransferase [Flavobacteriales bacterium]
MLTISSRGQNMTESPIRKLSKYADQAKKDGKKVIHLNIGQPDIKPPTEVLTEMRQLNLSEIAYSPSDGLSVLKKSIQKYYQKNHIEVREKDILVTSGASEAILFVINAVTDFGDEIITFEPFYANYIGFAVFEGVQIKTIKATIENNFALPDLSLIEKQISPKTKAVLLCNPNNPTGYVYSKNELEILKNIALKHHLYLIVDEVYREFFYEDENSTKGNSVLNFPELKEHAIMLDSVSKRYSMCGARIGCIVSRNEKIIQTITKYAQARLCPPTIAQILANKAYNISEEYLQNVVKIYKERRDFLVDSLSKIEGVISSCPKGAFYLMVQLPVNDTDHFAQWMLEKFDWENKTLMVAPGSGFYNNPVDGKREIRIAYVLNKKELKVALTILEKALKTYPLTEQRKPKTLVK